MSLIKSSFKIGGLTLLSRIVGFVRESLIAKYLGAGTLSDAFFVAFRLPNLFRSIFAEGAFNAAFIPMFAKYTDKAAAKLFAEKVYSVMIVALLGLTAVAQLCMPWLVWLLASGFKEDPAKFDLAVMLTRITFPYLLFVSLVSLQGGILNSVNRFAAAAFSPVLLNLVMIIGMLGLQKYTATPAHAVSWGVFAAGIVQFLALYYSCRKAGFALKLRMPHFTPQIKTLLKRMLPVAIGAGVLQINVLINTQIASHISDGAVSYLYFADRISQLPLAIIGTAVGTALLPMLSKAFRETNHAHANTMQNKGFELCWFLSIPAAFALAAISQPIVEVLYERGKFTHEDTIAVGRALFGYSLGIPAFVLVKIFVPGFYANEDTKTPVQIAIFSIAVNVAVSFGLIYGVGMDHMALALATTISQWVNAILLWYILWRRDLFHFETKTLKKAVLTVLISILMAVITYYAFSFLVAKVSILVALAATIAVGGGVFALGSVVLGVMNPKELKSLLKH